MKLPSSLASISLVSITAAPTPQPDRRPPPALALVWQREAPQDNHLTPRDRIALLAWERGAARLGVNRVVVERPDAEIGGAEIGDFALIYDDAAEWARWAVAREAGAYLLWSPSSGRSFGRFPSITAALARIGTPDC